MYRYFDIGTMIGQEIDVMMNVVFPTVGQLVNEIRGFEASKENYEEAKRRFPRVKMFHVIISDHEGEQILYHATSRAGHSIYKSKKNVPDSPTSEVVKCTRFSVWLKRNIPDLDKSDNILKYNIEGAELDLFRDLDKEDMFKYFKIIRGCSGFDILKCSEIADKHSEFQDICRRNDIPLDHRWSFKNPHEMINWIKNPESSKEYSVDIYEKLVEKVKRENNLI